MPFAILQRRLEIPDLAALQRALHGVEGWSAADAAHVAADAFGILARNLEESVADQLVAALGREGIGVELVNESSLPSLPVAKKLRRAECRPDAFVAYDPHDREIAVPWDRLRLVCAGEVRLSQFRPVTRTLEAETWNDISDDYRITLPSFTANLEQRHWCWVADLVLTGGEHRFSVAAADFFPQGLSQRLSQKPTDNFHTFLRDFLGFASRATVNRAAFAIRENDPHAAPRYPSRNAYQEEMLWLLWRGAAGK